MMAGVNPDKCGYALILNFLAPASESIFLTANSKTQKVRSFIWRLSVLAVIFTFGTSNQVKSLLITSHLLLSIAYRLLSEKKYVN